MGTKWAMDRSKAWGVRLEAGGEGGGEIEALDAACQRVGVVLPPRAGRSTGVFDGVLT
jgi:hypothetical protein